MMAEVINQFCLEKPSLAGACSQTEDKYRLIECEVLHKGTVTTAVSVSGPVNKKSVAEARKENNFGAFFQGKKHQAEGRKLKSFFNF